MSVTITKKTSGKLTGPEQYEKYRLEGFRDARDGVFHPEAYAKGMARRAYTHGKEQWVELMAQER